MLRLLSKVIRFSTKKSLISNDPNMQVIQSKKKMLSQVAKKINLQLTPPILIAEDQQPVKKLSLEQKIELGLYIPKSPFNPRLSRQAEKQYLQSITKDLYHEQKNKLQTYLRILQNNLFLQESGVTLDHYINIIYKDIYARYLISKGVGIQWQGYYANTGVVNPSSVNQYDDQAKIRQNYSILLDFIDDNVKSIHKDKSIGLYSYIQQHFVHHNNITVQKTKRIGYYLKQQLTQFGKYQTQFNILAEKQGKVYVLVFVQYLQKLFSPNAICINPDDRYIILKRFVNAQNIQTQYLIISLRVHKDHQKYFKDQKYQKHSTFDGRYLIGMKCMKLPFISQLPDYQRNSNTYLVNSNYHLADFERVKAHGVEHPTNYIHSKGQYIINGEETTFYANDIKLGKKLEEKFMSEGMNFMDFYDIFEDQVYYDQKTNEVLKFRIGDKYFIDIAQNNWQLIMQGLQKQKTIISQSKIKIPTINPGKKPKERRTFRKQKRELLKQTTQHYSLQESIKECTSIPISSLSQTVYKVPLFIKEQKLIPYQNVLSQQQLILLLQGRINQVDLTKVQQDGIKVSFIYANNDLLKSLLYLKNIRSSKDIFNIIIEPQSQTEQLIANAVHLNYLINKNKTIRGRRSSLNQQVKNNISLIKLHPTFTQDKKSISIKQLIQGVVKSNSKQQYAIGLEALRLWTAANDHYQGDRSITDEEVNKQLKHTQSIRKVFWDLLSLLPQQSFAAQAPFVPKLYINKFMSDMIDCYITNMEECYKIMNINKAYKITIDFFTNIVNQIYVKAIKKRIIAYPNLQQNQEHFAMIRRITELVAVIYPLFPFTGYHISHKNWLNWPIISNSKFYESVPLHNQMIKTRVKLRNKLILNKLDHSMIHCRSFKQNYSERDLQLFFNVDKVSERSPDISYRTCSVPLPKFNSISAQQKLTIYLNTQQCIRCDPSSKQTEYICKTCVDYLQQQIGEPLIHYPIQISNKTNDII